MQWTITIMCVQTTVVSHILNYLWFSLVCCFPICSMLLYLGCGDIYQKPSLNCYLVHVGPLRSWHPWATVLSCYNYDLVCEEKHYRQNRWYKLKEGKGSPPLTCSSLDDPELVWHLTLNLLWPHMNAWSCLMLNPTIGPSKSVLSSQSDSSSSGSQAELFHIIYCLVFLTSCAGDWTDGLLHAKQMLYYWARACDQGKVSSKDKIGNGVNCVF